MSAKNQMLCKVGAILLMALALVWPLLSFGQDWVRIPIAKGGVVFDVQQLVNASGSATNAVWVTNYENGAYRSNYSSGWGSWVQCLPGRGTLGIEAVKDGATEYVMAATDGGLYYRENPPTSGGPDYCTNWRHPNGVPPYPAELGVEFNDAAFYFHPTNHYANAETQFFALLVTHVSTNNWFKGIYRWDYNDNEFDRVDTCGTSPHDHNFYHIMRDLDAQNVLYTVKGAIYDNSDPPNLLERGGLFRFSGEYLQQYPFQEVPIVTGDDYIISINPWGGFNQIKDPISSVVYSYVLAYWWDDDDPEQHYKWSIFVSNNLAEDEESFQEVCEVTDIMPESPLYRDWDETDFKTLGPAGGPTFRPGLSCSPYTAKP
jgi:hypothetical protein